MALNKFMHPRNPYRQPPDFKCLAVEYPEFRRVARQDTAGKVKLDWSDPAAVRALTTCLLARDFRLQVELPPDCLVPTLPSRLNYLLWLEDLVMLLPPSGGQSQVRGLDLGTGTCPVYPLLAARHLGWAFTGTESNTAAAECAERNIGRNGLEDRIAVVRVDEGQLLQPVLTGNCDQFTFSMCNPPFFTFSKQFPSNKRPGGENELQTEGGEVEFVSKLIQESAQFKSRVKAGSLNIDTISIEMDVASHSFVSFNFIFTK